MKFKPLSRLLSLVCLLIAILPAIGQTSEKTAPLSVPTKNTADRTWKAAIDKTHNFFIENKGQFDGKAYSPETPVLYSVQCNGVDIYFSATGVTYCHDKTVKLSEEDREEMEFSKSRSANSTDAAAKAQKLRDKLKPKSYFLNMQWAGSNPYVEIIAQDKADNYFTYGDSKDKTGSKTLKANAFTKITYKNIYPNIDVEYTFPDNKPGIKYAFILHPGADPSLIQMHYSEAKKIDLAKNGDLKITSSFGDFIDHAPFTYYQNGGNIESAFRVKDNIVSFILNEKQLSSTNQNNIIIDPWTTLPTFATLNRAYDIDWDYLGNVYAYGGDFPFQVIKFNNAGAIQWTFTGNTFTSAAPYYGDFAIDRTSGTSYVCEGFNGTAPTAILKVNAAGIQTSFFTGNPNINEMWRIAYNSCTHQGALGCGNTEAIFQAATFDSALTSITPVNILSANPGESYIDIALLAIDDTNCYMVSAENSVTSFANTLVKAPLATLSPSAYLVNSGHHFTEVASVVYAGTGGTNGFNGMAKSKKYLYTYDGATLKKWNPFNGTLITSVTVSSNTYLCGGIAVDACDNLFIGTINGVSQYDSTLTFVSSMLTSGITYDVMLGSGGQILACGDGYVSALPLFSSCSSSTAFTLNCTSTPSTCAGNDGTATVVVTGTGTYSYSWIPGGQTTATITGLSPGTYTVIVFDNSGASCSSSGANIDTVVVSAISGFTGQSCTSTPITCLGNTDGTATINVTGGTMPYTYLWSGGQITQSITGLAAGTYTITVLDSVNCQTIDSVTVTAPNNALTISLTESDIFGCQPGSIATSISGGTFPYTFLWSSGDTTQNIISVTVAGSYTLTVTDANGCVTTDSITVNGTFSQPWSLSSVEINENCGGSVTIHLLNTDNSSFIFFSWYDSNFNFLPGDSIITGLAPGTYFCFISDANFCNDTTLTIVINSSSNYTVTTAQTNLACNGDNNGSAWVSSVTGTGPFTYSWNTFPAQSNDSILNLSQGTYICTVTDSAGCQIKDTVIIIQPLAYTIATSSGNSNCIQSDGTATVLTSGATAPYTYSWNTSPVQTTATATGLSAGTYNCYINDANNCKDTVSVTVLNNAGSLNANAGSNVTISAGTSTPLTGSGGGTYSWTPSSGLSCTDCPDPIASPAITTDYCLTVADTNGCTDSACVTVTVEYNGFIVPNSFSPNGDGKNDVFFFPNIYTKCFDCKIYNRWGTMIYEWENGSNGWNGTIMKNGKPASDDVYYFILEYCDIANAKKTVTGFIQLLR